MKLRAALSVVVLFAVSPLLAEQVTFTLDPAQSQLKLVDVAFLEGGATVELPAQQETGDTVGYFGSIVGDLVGDTLTFSGGSSIVALEHPKVADFIPAEGSPGGPEQADTQDLNYAYFLPGYPISETDTTTLYVQLFDVAMDLTSGAATSGQAAKSFDVTLNEGGYALVLDNPDIINDTTWFNRPFNVIDPSPETRNNSDSLVSLTTVGNLQTLTLPINSDFVFTIDACCGNTPPTEFIVTGQLVATRNLGGVPEDLNGDGAVDAADAGIMFGNWAMSGAGDLDGDGTVDAADAGLMFAAWTGDATPVSAVPEPSVAASLGLLIFMMCRKRA